MNQGVKDGEIEDRFFVRGRMAVLNLLHELIYRGEPITVSFNHGADHFITTLLDAKDAALIFELSPDLDVNRRFLLSSDCTFIANPDGIRVQFSGAHATQILWDDSEVFSIALPEQVARLQRQQSIRILIPSEARWPVKLFSNDGVSLGEWTLHNLSVGGLGVTVNERWQLGPNQTIARASLVLPDHGEIDCAVTLRHETGRTEEESVAPNRIGLAFVNLLPEIGVAIQRYIIRMEHERRSLPENDEADDYP